MYKPCLRVFCHCCSPPLTLIDILSSSKVFVVTKWTMWKSRKNSKAKERNLELETSFPQLGKPTFPLALEEHSLQIPPSACHLLPAPRFPHTVITGASPASRVSPVCRLLSLRTRKHRSSRDACSSQPSAAASWLHACWGLCWLCEDQHHWKSPAPWTHSPPASLWAAGSNTWQMDTDCDEL